MPYQGPIRVSWIDPSYMKEKELNEAKKDKDNIENY